MMEGVKLLPMRARASRWKSGIPTDPDPSHLKTPEQGRALAKNPWPTTTAALNARAWSCAGRGVDASAVHRCGPFQGERDPRRCRPCRLAPGRCRSPMQKSSRSKKMEMRDWHIKKLWNYYVRKGATEDVLPSEWKDALVPTKEMLQARPALSIRAPAGYMSRIRYLAMLSEEPAKLAGFYAANFGLSELGRSSAGDVSLTDGGFNFTFLRPRPQLREPHMTIGASPSGHRGRRYRRGRGALLCLQSARDGGCRKRRPAARASAHL